MVKLFGGAFAALLVCAHLADLQGDAYERPLSMFRDYDPAWIGYALFGVLVGIGVETSRTAFRIGAEFHAVVYLVATGLLAVVAATSSYDSLHTTCALTAMAILFVYYAVMLYQSDSMFWFVMHLLTPGVLMMASRLESYGIWQKGMILYFLAATVVHQHLLAQWLPNRQRIKKTHVRIRVGRKQAA
jgi:hypothetical protein